MLVIKSKNKLYKFSDNCGIIVKSDFDEQLPSTASDFVIGAIPIVSGVSTGKKVYRILKREGTNGFLSGTGGVIAGILNSPGITEPAAPFINAGLGILEKKQVQELKGKKK